MMFYVIIFRIVKAYYEKYSKIHSLITNITICYSTACCASIPIYKSQFTLVGIMLSIMLCCIVLVTKKDCIIKIIEKITLLKTTLNKNYFIKNQDKFDPRNELPDFFK